MAAEIERRLFERPRNNSLISWDLELLHRSAEKSDRRLRNGEGRALEGLPVVLKDNIVVDGFQTTAGTRARIDVPESQAEAVDQLVAAGAIPYAKANMTELALRGHGRNRHFGDVAAPAAPGYLAGGSSSGSAAAVRLGLAAFALGTDTGGSVRMPAAACGVVGYKPAYNDLSKQGVVPLSQTCDHVGIFTRRVDEAATVLNGLGLTLNPDVPSLKVVYPDDEALGPLDPEQRRSFRLACEASGARPAPTDLFTRLFDDSAEIYDGIRAREAWLNFSSLAEPTAGIDGETAEILEGFSKTHDDRYQAALGQRQRIRTRIISALAGRAIMLLPTLGILAPAADKTTVDLEGKSLPMHGAMTRLSLPFNLAGVPACAIPGAPTRTGLTASVQLVCAPGDESALFDVAMVLERSFREMRHKENI